MKKGIITTRLLWQFYIQEKEIYIHFESVDLTKNHQDKIRLKG